MFKTRLNKKEVKVLQLLSEKTASLTELANASDTSLSWSSNCVKHLHEMGLIKIGKKGNKIVISLSDMPPGKSLMVLIREMPMLNLEALLKDSALKILPLLLTPGCASKEISLRTSLSIATVKSRLARWRRMGLLGLIKGNYILKSDFKEIINFVREWGAHVNLTILKDINPNSVIVWQWRDEFIFTVKDYISYNGVTPAGPTLLADYKYDIISDANYYYYSPIQKKISESEALIQTVLVAPLNPRSFRYMKQLNINNKILKQYIRKYRLKVGLFKEMDNLART